MAENRSTDQAAFPRPAQLEGTHDEKSRLLLPAQGGLTKREYFAIGALQGLLTHPGQLSTDVENQTRLAIQYADALLQKLAESAALKPGTSHE